MRYRSTPQMPHPIAISLLLFGMMFLLTLLPSVVFAETASSVDPLPRYTLSPKELGVKVAEAIQTAGIAEHANATVDVDDPHTVFGADQPMEIEVRGLQADIKTRQWSANIIFKNADKVMSAMPMKGRFQAMIELPALIKTLNAGDIITADNIGTQQFPTHYDKSDIIKTSESLIGKAARRNISANRPVREHEISAPNVVKKNDIVQLNYNNNSLHISTSGQVQADAAVGDMVEIKNVNSNQMVRAVIKDSRNANVEAFVQTSELEGNHANVN